MLRRRIPLVLMGLLAVLAVTLAACGSDDPTPTTAPAPTPTTGAPVPTPTTAPGATPTTGAPAPASTPRPSPMPTPEPEPSAARLADSGTVVLVALGEMNGSGQTGWAMLAGQGAQTLVDVTLLPGTASSELIHIHTGACGDGLGGVVHGLTNVDAGGRSTTTVEATLASLTSGGFAVNAHDSTNPSVYTACGNIPIDGDYTTITLHPDNDSAQTGYATLAARDDQTEVVVSLAEGERESGLIHIHTGACGDGLGGVAFGLTTLANGTSVTTIDAALGSLRTGGFAVNAHDASDPTVYTACGNIALAEVTMVSLLEENGSGQSGWAVLTAAGDRTLVAVSLGAGTLESNLIHIHEGSCGPLLGGVVHSLASVADGSSVTAVEASLADLLAGGFAVNAHDAADPSVYTACGNVPAGADTRTLLLGEQNDSGQRGMATLSARGAVTDVVLRVFPGALESELAHIHGGGCGADLGGVVHPLTKVTGGVSVTEVGASLAELLTGAFAVNVHKKGEGSVYTTCGKVPLTDAVALALGEMNDSGQTGHVLLTPSTGRTRIEVTLSPGTLVSELIHVHTGTCADLGGVVYPLTSVDAGGSSVTTVSVPLGRLMTGGFAINAHEKDNPSVYTACGTVPSAGETVTVGLDEDNASGQRGFATLTGRGAQTEVVVWLSSGVRSSGPVHIHNGSCGDDLGGVAHGLTSLDGSGFSVTTVDAGLQGLLAGPFAINAHETADASIYTACGNVPAPAAGLSVTLQVTPSRDNTLYEAPFPASNGAGQQLFAGSTGDGDLRRALLAFDIVGQVPAGSRIQSVTLTLNLDRTAGGSNPVALHRVLASWGEGLSDAGGQEGGGTMPQPGDVTWTERFFGGAPWTAEGGDFDAVASASTEVASGGDFTWDSTTALVADLQGWLDNPSLNHGWVLVGGEDSSRTSKRFKSRENPDVGGRPTLTITHAPPARDELLAGASLLGDPDY